MSSNQASENSSDRPPQRLKVLTPAQIQRIDELLSAVGDYGEVHLIIQHGQLRYINQVLSYKATDDSPAKK